MCDTLDFILDDKMVQDGEEKTQMKTISKEKHGGLSNKMDVVDDK